MSMHPSWQILTARRAHEQAHTLLGDQLAEWQSSEDCSEWDRICLVVVHQDVLEPVLFSIFIGDLDAQMECILSKLDDDTDLGGAVEFLEEQEGISWN